MGYGGSKFGAREKERDCKNSLPLPNEISSQPDHMRAQAIEIRLIVISPQRQPISQISAKYWTKKNKGSEL
jgi:hypothetical protein